MQQVLDQFRIGDEVTISIESRNRSGGLSLLDSITKTKGLNIRIVGYEAFGTHITNVGFLVPAESIVCISIGVHIPGLTSTWGDLPGKHYYRLRGTKHFERVGPFSDGLENWI